MRVEDFNLKFRVYYEDTDVSGFLYHSKYLNYCERARSEIFFKRGVSPINGESHFVVKKLEAEYLKSAKFGDTLKVKTSLLKMGGASVLLNQDIFRDGEKIFNAKILLAHLIGTKPSKIDDEVRQVFKELK
jgi:acyl-CoA thioester hydrolase